MTYSAWSLEPEHLSSDEPATSSWRERLVEAAAQVSACSRRDRLPIWVEYGDDGVLRASLGVDTLCAGCLEPVRPCGPVEDRRRTTVPPRPWHDQGGLRTQPGHRHDCGAHNPPVQVELSPEPPSAGSPVSGAVDVRHVVLELLFTVYAQVARRRQAINDQRARDARTALLVAADMLPRALAAELTAAGGHADSGAVLARLPVVVSVVPPGEQQRAVAVLVHAQLPSVGSVGQRWRAVALTAYALQAGTCDRWVEITS